MKKKKGCFKKFLIILIIAIISFWYIKSEFKDIYAFSAQENNSAYNGIGQEKVKNCDGYFTTFTTSEKNKKVYKEYKQNGSASWAENSYWGGTMEENGCGITCLSIILSGYGKKYTPGDLREKYYPVLNGEKIPNELSDTFNISNSGFTYENRKLEKEYIINYLNSNRPILICLWDKPKENRWTTKSHYMVLLATDGDDKIYVSNPNGGKKDSKSSGWYKTDEVIPYIAKALFIEDYAGK